VTGFGRRARHGPGLHDGLDEAAGLERTLALWRYETVSVTVRFLDALTASSPAR
jgi:hypothetical protein